MSVVVDLGSTFILCLLLVISYDAARAGRSIYILAFLGLAMTLLGRMSDGFIAAGPDVVMKFGGLALAAIALAVDLLFEEVDDLDDEPRRITTQP